MKLKHAMTRIQKVRGDEWPYRVRQAQKNVQDLLFGHRAQRVSHPDTLPCWPVDIQLDDWKPQLYARAALQVASKRKTAQSVRRALQGPSATARLSPA